MKLQAVAGEDVEDQPADKRTDEPDDQELPRQVLALARDEEVRREASDERDDYEPKNDRTFSPLPRFSVLEE